MVLLQRQRKSIPCPARLWPHRADSEAQLGLFAQRTLFFYCAGNELFFVCLYLMDFYPTPLGLKPEWFLWPLGKEVASSLTKTAINNQDSIQALTFEIIRKLTWPQVLGAITFPICAVKQVINAVQFWKAAKVLVGIDLAEREKKREKQGE